MSNTGTSVTGFSERRNDISCSMETFDRMPEMVRRALNYARAEWSVDYFAEWLPLMGARTVSLMVQKADEDWTRKAYEDRGFSAKDRTFLLSVDKKRAA